VGEIQTAGGAVPVAEQAGYAALDMRALFSSSQNGGLRHLGPAPLRRSTTLSSFADNSNESWAKLSRSGQWLAYEPDETKRNENYVTTFPQPGGKWQISTNGGTYPVWSRDGKELFSIGADGKLMAVEVQSGPKFAAGVRKALFPTGFAGNGFDVSKDGLFLIPTQVEQTGSARMTVAINWTAGLKK
jgi:hypothetical protein